jgi:outer membrane immunogenic protein
VPELILRYFINDFKSGSRGAVMKKVTRGIIAIGALIGTPALAADMALKAPPLPPPTWNWTGIYLGVAGGVGLGNTRQTDTTGVTSGSYVQGGGVLGGTVGANYQIQNIVVGAEFDMSWANVDGTTSNPLCSAGGGATCFTNLQWLNTDRLRLGVAVDRLLPYITGGAAAASIQAGQSSCATPIAGAIASCGTNTEWGWTVGGGLEAMVAPKWSVKFEYLYANFGTQRSYTVFIPVNVAENVSTVRLGVDYHFDLPLPGGAKY